MNIFEQYGVKEVMNVIFYSITRIEDEEFYIPVLYFDTLKVSTLSSGVETVSSSGGKANGKILSWNFGKDVKFRLEDALFSKLSLNMFLNGRVAAKMSDWTSAICKLNVANKYGLLNYSTKAYPSPQLTEKEWDIVFQAAEEIDYPINNAVYVQKSDNTPYVAENRKILKERYYKRQQLGYGDEIGFPYCNLAMSRAIIVEILKQINSVKKLGKFENDLYQTSCVDRFEKAYVLNKNGLTINGAMQKENLLRYYNNDKSTSYTIFYDLKTMLPLFSADGSGTFNSENFTLKYGTPYGKWTRTVDMFDNSFTMLGTDIIINQETFPAEYKIIGEFPIRTQRNGKDQMMQMVLNRAKIDPSTNIELKADGGPTTFSIDVNVLMNKNGNMLELKQFDVEEDKREGGLKIIPQTKKYSYTPTNNDYIDDIIDNNEIY